MFQSGERDVPLMTAQLIGKSDQDLQDLAAYYASLPAKIGEAKGSDGEIKSARMIYKGGIAAKGVAACALVMAPADWVTTRRASHALVDNPLTIQSLS